MLVEQITCTLQQNPNRLIFLSPSFDQHSERCQPTSNRLKPKPTLESMDDATPHLASANPYKTFAPATRSYSHFGTGCLSYWTCREYIPVYQAMAMADSPYIQMQSAIMRYPHVEAQFDPKAYLYPLIKAWRMVINSLRIALQSERMPFPLFSTAHIGASKRVRVCRLSFLHYRLLFFQDLFPPAI